MATNRSKFYRCSQCSATFDAAELAAGPWWDICPVCNGQIVVNSLPPDEVRRPPLSLLRLVRRLSPRLALLIMAIALATYLYHYFWEILRDTLKLGELAAPALLSGLYLVLTLLLFWGLMYAAPALLGYALSPLIEGLSRLSRARRNKKEAKVSRRRRLLADEASVAVTRGVSLREFVQSRHLSPADIAELLAFSKASFEEKASMLRTFDIDLVVNILCLVAYDQREKFIRAFDKQIQQDIWLRFPVGQRPSGI